MAKLIFISQDFHPDAQATSQLFSDLMAGLAGRQEIEVLAGYPAVRPVAERAGAQEIWRGLMIQRGGTRRPSKRNLAFRAWAYASYLFWLAGRLGFCTGRGARVIVSTNPPFAPLVVWFVSWWRGWQYDVLLLDIYPEGLIATGRLKPDSWLANWWHWANRKLFQGARQVLVIGRDMADLCQSRYGLSRGKIHRMALCSPVESASCLDPASTALGKRLGIRAEFIVQYSGNMGLWHDLENIVRAAGLLSGDPRIHFLLIGDGLRRNKAQALAGKLGLGNITWLDYQPRTQLMDTLSYCHAAIVSQREGLEGVAVPSKLYGILASGRAVLAQVPATSETALVVLEEGCGLVLTPGDFPALARAVRLLCDNPRSAIEMGARAHAAYQAKYTLRAGIQRLGDLLSYDNLP